MLITSIWNLCWPSRNFAAAFLIVTLFFFNAEAATENWIPSPVDQTNEDVNPPLSTATEFTERLLQIDIDRQQINQTVLVLEDKAGALYLWSHDLKRWRFRTPDTRSAMQYHGETYFPLGAISYLDHQYDRKKLTLYIKVKPDAYTVTTRSTQSEELPDALKPSPGGFLNYDLFVAQTQAASQRSGLFELGFFNHYGVGLGNVLVSQSDDIRQVTRLDTNWTRDDPERRQTLHLGDAISAPGMWGRSVRFGGIQFGTNFNTQPGLITAPPQSVQGLAALPSSVDVFVNNALVSSQSVPPGPFAISHLPIITGAGEVELVVRDLLGREQRILQSFYGSQTLLQEGLESYSGELGFARKNFGIHSNDYGGWMSSATYRRGLSEHYTGELHAEAMRNQATIGAGGDYLIPQFGTINIYAASSQSESKRGGMVLLGIDRLAQPWSMGARSQWSSREFTQVGLETNVSAPTQVSSLNLSYASHRGGTLGFALLGQHYPSQPDTRIATFSYSVSLNQFATFSISALRYLAGETSTTIFAMLNMTLDQSTSLSVSSQSLTGGGDTGGTGTELTSTLQRNLPPGEGYGYRLQARSAGAQEASATLQSNIGSYTMEAARNQGTTATRLNVSGGIALLGNEAYLSRRIEQSFAVVHVSDYPDVRIFADNQPAGLTNRSGSALIPRLRAYDSNIISIDQRDLPLDAEIGALKIEAIPYFRSGLAVTFPIRRIHGATFRIQLENGTPLPLSALVQDVSNSETYRVGNGGAVYVPDIGGSTKLSAIWDNRRCDLEIQFSPSADPLPDLGIFVCKASEVQISIPIKAPPSTHRFWHNK